MFSFRLTPLAAALLVFTAHADPIEPLTPRAGQLEVNADRLSGIGSDTVHAEGSVVATRDQQRVEADWLDYFADKQRVKAGQRVRMQRDNDTLTGTTLDYDLRQETGTLNAASLRHPPSPRTTSQNPDDLPFDSFSRRRVDINSTGYRVTGERIDMQGKGQYQLSGSQFTTCEPLKDDWFIKSQDLTLDNLRNEGVARHATLEFMGVPLLYSPWLDFPLHGKRKSGLLAPTVKVNSKSGFELLQPYYFNLAPNYDATLTPHLISRRGLMVGGEFRYLQPTYNGRMAGEVLPNDNQRHGDTRYLLDMSHLQQVSPTIGAGYTLRYASDTDFFRDFGNRTTIADNNNLLRDGWVSWNSPLGQLTARAQRYQTMQDTRALVDEPYARLPQLTWQAARALPYGLQAQAGAEFVQFSHARQVTAAGLITRQEGKRLIFNPSLSLPLTSSYGFFTPKLGLHYTEYDLNGGFGDGTALSGRQSRVLPLASVDTGLMFERDTQWFGRNLTHTLEPRAYYVYIPYKDQSKLPNFDSARYDVNFAQLFTENQFAGGDRINNANQITAALTSRFIDAETGMERLRLAVGQRYYFADSKVTLTPYDTLRTKTLSDFLASVGGQVNRSTWLDSLYQFNTELNKTERYQMGVRYAPQTGHAASLRYRYQRDTEVAGALLRGPSRQIDIAGQWPIQKNWYVVGRQNYSLTSRQTLESLLGVEYNAGCWALRVVGQRYIKDLTSSNTTFYVQLELNGLGGIGSNPLETLRQSIPGYSKINDLPQ